MITDEAMKQVITVVDTSIRTPYKPEVVNRYNTNGNINSQFCPSTLQKQNNTSTASLGAFIFVSNNTTHSTCMNLKLFGHSNFQPFGTLKPGSTIYLHNVDRQTIFGPYIAESYISNHNPTAWDGRYPPRRSLDFLLLHILLLNVV